ncbi:uncharacterized protein LOC119084463 [Bradysia coprophila]|uniref:uncharacterized protein LOC119084463 n=1 Tax=Bradysia coprophila TaxID=38358 RepID=UPI00187DAE77|nr:uncharacterized protein LOC119084463 [Bradysia coprophila]
MFIFYIFVSMLLVSGTSAVKCTPGHKYNDGCNECTCTCEGDGYACTLKYCEDNPIFCDTRGTTVQCQDGHSYFDGCNWCTCNKGLGYICTLKGCIDNPVVCYSCKSHTSVKSILSTHMQRYSRYLISKMFVVYIFAALMLVISRTAAVKCPPGHTYNDGCNNCFCSSNGDGYACTRRYCEGNPITCDTRGTTIGCPIGHRYFDGCNWCTCGNGKEYACTKIGCRDNPVVCYVR